MLAPHVGQTGEPRPATGRFRNPGALLGAAALLTVFAVHFRPWQAGLLEDWGFATAWEAEGLSGLSARIPATLGRPLHLVPHYLGLVLSDGGFVGPYGVLAAVAVAQAVFALWAVKPLTQSRPLRWSLALAIALHPWWAAGDILRFLPAQVSVLAVVIWFGGAVRYLADGRRRWIPVLVLVPLLGLLNYQALAGALALGSVIVALSRDSSWGRRIVVIGLAAATSAVDMIWSVILAPRLAPNSYEAQLITSHVDLLGSVRAILRTLVLHAPATLAALVGACLVVIALGFSQHLSPERAWLLLGGVALAPLSAMVYASQMLHLHDPERVAFPTGVTAWLVVACALPTFRSQAWTRWVLPYALGAVSLLGALLGYSMWTSYSEEQHELLGALEPARASLPDDSRLVVEDRSGRYGDVYTLLPPYLGIAAEATFGPGASVELCTPAGVERRHPVAELFPIATTPDCGALLDGVETAPLGTISADGATLDLIEIPATG